MNIVDGLIYKAIFGTDLKASDLTFKGGYDASIGTPPTPVILGDFYVITNGGTFSSISFNANDFAWYDGATWSKTPALTTGVTLVNGQTGNVILDTDDIAEGANKYVTSIDLAKIANLPNDTIAELVSKFDKSSDTSDDITEGLTKLFLTSLERSKLVNVPADTNTQLSDKLSKTTDTLDDVLNGTTYVKSENNFSDSYRDKLDNLTDNYKGSYIDDVALKAAYPTGNEGDYATVQSTGTIWIWSVVLLDWIDTLSGSIGDMLTTVK